MSQVSTLPSPSYHTSGPSNSNPRDSPTDPAQLLRQAALSSRKLSRRKLDAGPSGASFSRPLSRSIATTPSISLDYGQEEPLSTPETPQQPSAPAPFRAPTPSSPPRAAVQRDGSSGAASGTPLDDDASMREEGEISESEDPPFRPPLKSITAVTGAAYANFKLEASGSAQSSPFSVLSRSPSEKAEDAYQHATPPITTPVGRAYIEAEPAALSTRTASESFRLETPLYVLDPDHVRPRLSLTQKQYDTAKEVILDILGYGVPPEYLIDCGLSKEIIYYVFTELNLRLPSNLDTAGIPPYPPPPDVIASILRPQSGYPLSPSATPGPTAESDITRPGSVGHLNLSPRASVPHGESTSATAPQPATTVSVNGSLSASVLALSESTLTAIEQQRKQELLARKAVQASRKRKESVSLSVTQALAPSTSTASTGADISAKSAVSAVSVEDFLNSIGPPLSDTADPNGDPDQVKAPGLMKQSSPEPMSIDEAIPGFGRSTVSEYDQPWSSVNRESVPPPSESTSFPRSASASERSPSVEREKELPTHRASQALDNPPTRSRSNGLPASHFAKDNERDSRRSSTTPQPTAPIPRRGTKRPVAADFDSEPMSKAHTPPVLSRTGSGAGFSNGATYHPNPHVRRKMNGVTAGGFASLNNARRCVIDVSDSEDEAREDETPSTASAPGVSQASARDSALALELEIERMRKMIREREEIKLRKQAVGGNRFTSPKAHKGVDGVKPLDACFQGVARDVPSVRRGNIRGGGIDEHLQDERRDLRI
ncbi:hypothetical protein BJV74DRAFT_881167 [Russula compacta]|nr:hypothetical protein BJV74DRAFT_881167 [Russula compacta]